MDSENSSEDLSQNSETYDFLMVCMPLMRPAPEPESDGVEMYEKPAEKKKTKGKKGAKKAMSTVISKQKPALISGVSAEG